MENGAGYAALRELDELCRRHAVGLPRGETATDEWIGVGFRVGPRPCVAQMGEVTEILPVPDTIRVPRARSWVIGLANVRGTLLPVMDLEGFLSGSNLARSVGNRVLVIEHGDLRAGLLVPEVLGMKRFRKDERAQGGADDAVDDPGADVPYLEGLFRAAGRSWHIFSMSKLARSPEFLRVAQ